MEKHTNPKDAIGSNKLPLHLWPTTATAMGTIGLANGMLKYGRANWRKVGVRASIYYDACLRHMQAWFEGEENDPDDGVPHLGAALACLAIIVDAKAAGKLNDDRAFNGAGYRRLVSELTPHIERLKAHHEGRAPKHYSIGDDQVGEMTAAPDAMGYRINKEIQHENPARANSFGKYPCLATLNGEIVVKVSENSYFLGVRPPKNDCSHNFSCDCDSTVRLSCPNPTGCNRD